MMEKKEKVELLNAFFASVFTVETSLQESWALRLREEGRKKEDFLVVENSVRDRLGRFNTHKYLAPDGMHSRV